jgi:membrane-associated phospholipid phosphatase
VDGGDGQGGERGGPGEPVTRQRVAAAATYLLEPKNWIVVTVIALGWRYGGVAGLGWGALAAFFAAVLPTVFITRGVRQGRWADRNVGARGSRLAVLTFILASVFSGLCALTVGGAPRELTWYLGCMLGSVAVLALITTVWKISIHCAVASGAVTILALIYGPWVLSGYVLVAITAWSRVELGDHTRAQVIAGTVLGAAAAIASYALIRLPPAADLATGPTAGPSRPRSPWRAACRSGRTPRSSPRSRAR